MTHTVLLIEDDPHIRQLLGIGLESAGLRVVSASDGDSGLRAADSHEWDVALVDLRLPDTSGFEVVGRLRERFMMPIVILTAHGDSDDVVTGLEAGADDFLGKPISTHELVARLRAILRRSSGSGFDSQQSVVSAGPFVVDPLSHEVFVGGEVFATTRTEFGVLRELVRRHPNTVSRHELLDSVWGYDYLGDSRLVDMQIYRLRGKLEKRGLGESIVTVRGVGFKLVV